MATWREDREGSVHQLIIHMVGGWFFLMDGAEEGDPWCCRWVGRSGAATDAIQEPETRVQRLNQGSEAGPIQEP